MASVTLVESAKLALDDLVAGIIENIITVNHMFEMIPFDGIDGNSLAYNRENVLGDVETLGVGGTIAAKAAATFTKVNSSLTTIIGDAEVNGLIQATRSSDGNDQTAVQIASKAKSAGRSFQQQLITGDGTGDDFTGLENLVAGSQSIVQDTAGVETNGGDLSLEKMDELIDLVTDKDGNVDYLTGNARTLRSYYSLLRALGGASIMDSITLPSGTSISAYRGIPLFRNDYVPVNQTTGSLTTGATLYAGTFDDGSRSSGIAGLTAQNASGIAVVSVGESETKDEHITRVKWYCGLALFSEKGLAALTGIAN
ncbi:MAG: phage major capsid protein [Robiginitomaculum sp.]|nr:MAG: phage major capsid protein [Robiginitomaculum sp.]